MEKSGGGNALETKGTGGHRGDGYTRSGLVPKEPGLLRKVQCNRTMKKVQAGVEVENVSRAVELNQQGAWTRWEGTLQPRITWAHFLSNLALDKFPSSLQLPKGSDRQPLSAALQPGTEGGS